MARVRPPIRIAANYCTSRPTNVLARSISRCGLFGAAQAVECLGGVGQVEGLLKGAPGAGPVAGRERLVPAGESVLRDSRRHRRMVAPRLPENEPATALKGWSWT
jgi:hypothetical protein